MNGHLENTFYRTMGYFTEKAPLTIRDSTLNVKTTFISTLLLVSHFTGFAQQLQQRDLNSINVDVR